jgi:electron transport complex protein RnfG
MRETLNLGLRLALICGVAALLLSQVDATTREPIRQAMLRERMEAVAAVMPPFDNAPDADRVDLNDAAGERSYWRGYQGEAPVGAAFKGLSKAGYSGEIELMLGVDPDGKVSGLRILRHAETPGLGAKYADPALLARFYVGHTLADTDWRVKADGGDLDAVTGATVTGRALAGAISDALTQYDADRAQVDGAPRSAAADSSSAAADSSRKETLP